jgi:hypothetical protein
MRPACGLSICDILSRAGVWLMAAVIELPANETGRLPTRMVNTYVREVPQWRDPVVISKPLSC